MKDVTDKKYYLDGWLKTILDFSIIRQKHKGDNLFIIDGDEGSGKTTFSWGIGKYLAWKTGKEFSVQNNIFFDIKELMKKATTSTQEVLIWDEAALEGLSKDHMRSVQTNLIKTLMTTRSRGHFFIFLVPKIYKLNRYVTEDRCKMWFHVYSPNDLERGYFYFYEKKKKDYFLDQYYRNHKKMYHLRNFFGRFTKDYMNIVSQDEYEQKKNDAVSRMFQDSKSTKEVASERRYRELKEKIVWLPEKLQISAKQFAELLGIDYKNY